MIPPITQKQTHVTAPDQTVIIEIPRTVAQAFHPDPIFTTIGPWPLNLFGGIPTDFSVFQVHMATFISDRTSITCRIVDEGTVANRRNAEQVVVESTAANIGLILDKPTIFKGRTA